MSNHPGFVDLQINGYAGVDFNSDSLSDQQLDHACRELLTHGNQAVFPTLITASDDQMRNRLQRLVSFRQNHPEYKSLLTGWHFEGPFISSQPGYIGAHPAEHARAAETHLLEQLLEGSDNLPVIVTLAPEQDRGGEVTRWLTDQNVIVAAGHTDCSVDELKCCLDQGLKLFTHLGNGCPLQMHRHNNIISRVLSLADKMAISLICDGWHVPWFVLGTWLKLIPPQNVIAVTDAISAAGCGPGQYPLGTSSVHVGDDGVPRVSAGGQFAGSALTMPQCVENLKTQLNLTEDQVQKLTSTNAEALYGSC